MKLIIHLYTLFLVVVLLIVSCSRKEDDANVLINIEEEFDVLLLEELEEGDNPLMIHLRTKAPLDCINYTLNHSHSVNHNKIVVSIDELELEGDCEEGETFAESAVHFGKPASGDYEFQVNLSLNSITNYGSLKIFDDHYEVTMETTHGINFPFQELKSIPDQYFWGYFQLIDGTATDIRDAFYTDLANYTAPADLSDGHYGYFDIEDGLPSVNPFLLNLGTAPPGSFLHQLNGDKSELLEMVEDYQTNNEGRIRIVLYTAEGEIL